MPAGPLSAATSIDVMLCGVVGTPTLALNCAIPVYRNHGAMRVAAHSVRRPAAVVAPYQDLMGLSVKMEVGPESTTPPNFAAAPSPARLQSSFAPE
jgi:hypothetical protein